MNRVLIPAYEEIVTRVQNNKLWDFPGGVFPAQQKELSNQQPIESISLPERLYIPLKQHIGVEGQLIVAPGEQVLKGQPLTRSANPFSVPVHAPTSGTVVSIGPHISAHPSALPEQTLIIEPDNLDKWTMLSPLQDYQSLPKVSVLEAICNAGISGMGGAGFPTHIKAAPKKDVEFIIINGVECEPYITADDRLMREHAWQIRQGIDVLCHLLSPKQVYIAIEDNKPEAIEAMRVACQQSEQYKVVPIATKYPAGGEKQLIQVITNREVPKQGLPIDVGVIMHNVGTCFAIADAIFSGKPLIQRVVTITGKAVETPKNVWALIGSPVAHLLSSAGYVAHRQAQKHIIMGGPMMGFTVASDQVPVVKITNCLLLPTSDEMAEPEAEQPCIRCSACADACPVSLLPQQLFWHSKAKELDKAQEFNLFDCIECGACAYVCPSEISLVHYYRVAKAEIRVEQEEKQKSDKARERFESRAARLVREQEARDEKHRKAAEARKSAMQNKGNDAQDKIAAALARAKAKKAEQAQATANNADVIADQETQPKATEPTRAANAESAPQKSGTSKDDRVAAAIARAKAKKAQRSAPSDADVSSEQVAQPEAAEDSSVNSAESAPQKSGTSKDDRVAAAIARAKAKNAQRSAPSDADVSSEHVAQPEAAEDSAINSAETAAHKSGTSKDDRVAAAIARAKAKKAQRLAPSNDNASDNASLEPSAALDTETHISKAIPPQSQTSDAVIAGKSKDERVAAAIAKAKAKKAQKSAESLSSDTPNGSDASLDAPTTSSDSASGSSLNKPNAQIQSNDSDTSKDDRVAAAIAKAKAKKALKETQNASPKSGLASESVSIPPRESAQQAVDEAPEQHDVQELDPAAQKKARIAAAVAKAKAKKIAKDHPTGETAKLSDKFDTPSSRAQDAQQGQETPGTDAEQALDEKKRRIAAAVAKAKAKKAAQMKSSEE
ncbi:electron transport complex protein RnfC [Paraglaciecola mesophila KMM 241]|uniref:Ion-translocating oxidoreductase complex subunit C n=1 Tax=Paraglaciecola mesophila KMM 241 TaxID=1128912 RepID=K6Z534_9ALTE|nr:electron transport complex subunit RsxC [Paraglaciecola mesophila]GAC25497.1 electron transport complex protein RnfC [Paraglaciecola mesophila KMM 241]